MIKWIGDKLMSDDYISELDWVGHDCTTGSPSELPAVTVDCGELVSECTQLSEYTH